MAKEVVGMCNLCFENKILIKGYIIPDWSSKLSGKITEYVSIDSNTATSNIMPLQETFSNQTPQGPDAEYLFCLECKKALDKGEDLLREIVHPSTQQSPNISELKDFTIEFKNAKTIEKFYLALGGLVLKAHISKHDPWKNFVLTKKQKNLIVSGIKEKNLSQNIQFTILKIYNLDNFKVGNFTDKIRGLYQLSPFDLQTSYPPLLMTYGGFMVMFVFGGLVLLLTFHKKLAPYKVSTDPSKVEILPLDIRYLIKQDEVLSVPNMISHYNESTFSKIYNAIKKTPLDSRCPCRAYFESTNEIEENLTFGNCCFLYWGLGKV